MYVELQHRPIHGDRKGIGGCPGMGGGEVGRAPRKGARLLLEGDEETLKLLVAMAPLMPPGTH